MHAPLLECIAVFCLGAALLLLLIAPVAERHVGSASTTSTLALVILLLVSSAMAGLSSADVLGGMTGLGSAALLAASLLSYLMFRARRTRALADKASTKPPGLGANCRSRHTSGDAMTGGPDKDTWRTYLYTVYSTSPSHGQLTEFAKAWGGAYYILYFTTGSVEVQPTVDIVCEHAKDGKCLADASEKGSTGAPDPPVRVVVANVISSQDDRVRVAVSMSAALNASGGPSVSITPGGVGPTIAFPDASLDAPFAMGTYRWVCEEVEE